MKIFYMKLSIISLLVLFNFSIFSQSFTIQNDYITVNGLSTDADFYDNTYLEALTNDSIYWKIVQDSLPQGWQFSTCFPNCHAIGVTTGNLDILEGTNYYLNGHFYPNNVSGEGKMVMEIGNGNGTTELVTWYGIAGNVSTINSNLISNKKIKYIYNSSGQIVSSIYSNQIFLIKYLDGSTKKVFITE